MAQSDVMAEQFRMPSGPVAPAVAASLNRRNHGLIQESITALDVRAGHRTLDVGFGGGLSLVLLAAAAADGHVAGIDPSSEMVARARRLLALPVGAGRMSLELGDGRSAAASRQILRPGTHLPDRLLLERPGARTH